MPLNRVLVRVEAAFPGLLRVAIPSWDPNVPLYVLRKSLPPEVDRKVLSRGYLFAEADLEAPTPAALVASLTGWDWRDTPE
jgi:hypothetical protein